MFGSDSGEHGEDELAREWGGMGAGAMPTFAASAAWEPDTQRLQKRVVFNPKVRFFQNRTVNALLR